MEMVDFLLRSGANETIIDQDGRTTTDLVAEYIVDDDGPVEAVERVRGLLENAPTDRALRRRATWCCAILTPTGRSRHTK